ncbi:hypothetical protein CC99x_001250 [Candidatus Berkiella cookevillensis]|uniref:HicB family protein n=1 Tax=Candidatus Berkiella cookevillensis TaxID=437022 RepID=A0A0Q9YG71_9GAMM|nr:hypothetical protein [Candidatus Berkiella cookevillensis]MCS5707523.1 hypothetical protein [Candidatus Berkiella cookevillensis]
MRYKGMVAKYEYVVSVGVFVGEIINCPDVVSFSAQTLAQLQSVMQDAVDNYFAYKKEVLASQFTLHAQEIHALA